MTAPRELTVRPARGSDLPRLAEIEAVSFSDAWPVELLAVELIHPHAILLTASRGRGSVAGYAALRYAAGEAELLRVGVDPAERRRGLARALVEEGLSRLHDKQIEVCHLEVRIDNRGAIALYETLGFEPTGRRRGYYSDGTDALLMSKTLSDAPGPAIPLGG